MSFTIQAFAGKVRKKVVIKKDLKCDELMTAIDEINERQLRTKVTGVTETAGELLQKLAKYEKAELFLKKMYEQSALMPQDAPQTWDFKDVILAMQKKEDPTAESSDPLKDPAIVQHLSLIEASCQNFYKDDALVQATYDNCNAQLEKYIKEPTQRGKKKVDVVSDEVGSVSSALVNPAVVAKDDGVADDLDDDGGEGNGTVQVDAVTGADPGKKDVTVVVEPGDADLPNGSGSDVVVDAVTGADPGKKDVTVVVEPDQSGDVVKVDVAGSPDQSDVVDVAVGAGSEFKQPKKKYYTKAMRGLKKTQGDLRLALKKIEESEQHKRLAYLRKYFAQKYVNQCDYKGDKAKEAKLRRYVCHGSVYHSDMEWLQEFTDDNMSVIQALSFSINQTNSTAAVKKCEELYKLNIPLQVCGTITEVRCAKNEEFINDACYVKCPEFHLRNPDTKECVADVEAQHRENLRVVENRKKWNKALQIGGIVLAAGGAVGLAAWGISAIVKAEKTAWDDDTTHTHYHSYSGGYGYTPYYNTQPYYMGYNPYMYSYPSWVGYTHNSTTTPYSFEF
jgi:hypothetical protein